LGKSSAYTKKFKLVKLNAASDFWFTTSATDISGCMLTAINTNYEVHCEACDKKAACKRAF